MNQIREISKDSKAWPFVEAHKLLDRLKGRVPEKGYVLFETGYGPSGLPHVGTFGEIARTSMVRHAFHQISDIPTKLVTFSDDMDGLRKVPENVPNQDMIAAHLGKPLSEIPDPFGAHDSFAAHNNAELCRFLDEFGFDYEFMSATECYRSGKFDSTLRDILLHYDEVTSAVLPLLGLERRASYSPFLPVCPETGVVLQVSMVARDLDAGTVTYEDEGGSPVTVPVTGGHCKLQWRPDWAMRWLALGVDYEMSGKDLIDSVRVSGKIVRVIGGLPPVGFTYEHFLDENGAKISKSLGNGLTMEEWLRYAPPESLSQFMYQKPHQAKRLYFDVIPRNVDEYLNNLDRYPSQEGKDRLANSAWHIHGGEPPEEGAHLSYNILLNLAAVCNTEEKSVLWYFISRYRPDATPETAPMLDRLTEYAVNYFCDFVKPNKRYRAPTDIERAALEDLQGELSVLPNDANAEYIQTQIYKVGKRHDFDDLKAWFKALYEILLGQSTGPRIGSFVVLYGIKETRTLIAKVLAGEDLAAG